MTDNPSGEHALPPPTSQQAAGAAPPSTAQQASAALMAGFKSSLKEAQRIRADQGGPSASRQLDIDVEDSDNGFGEEEEDEEQGAQDKGKQRRISPRPSVLGDQHEAPVTAPSTPPKRFMEPIVKSRPEQVRAMQLNEFTALFDDMSPKTRQAAISRALDFEANIAKEEEADEERRASINPYRKAAAESSTKAQSRQEVTESLKRRHSPREIQDLKRSRLDAYSLHHSASDPLIMKGAPFKPGAQSGSSVDMPSLVILNKLRNSMYVPLWHFTQEGIKAGRARDANVASATTAALSKLLDTFGASAQLGGHRKEDCYMTYQEMSSAFKILFKIYDKLVLETVGEAKEWIRTEKRAWQDGWEMVRESEYADRESSWEYLALYVDKLRQEYYNSPYGDRPDPSVWQDRIWRRTKDAMDMRRALPAPSAPTQDAPKQGKASASSSNKPFPTSTPGKKPQQGGACFQCGSRAKHNLEECNKGPDGKDGYAKRNATNKLCRASDGQVICHRYNLTRGCDSKGDKCPYGLHECSLCGKAEHGCQSCPITKSA
ncbi:hypothetical protein A4X06_0g9451 [Tilletia controversa]|uniref:C3H1-type domain-containing protein n=1 Tax=Tilletia controversa TaxID=13291 RepID=A0A8X7MIH8_9BASI|nr:hypothetical protein A4X06_0g9451 [Tilletia controversa]